MKIIKIGIVFATVLALQDRKQLSIKKCANTGRSSKHYVYGKEIQTPVNW